MKISGKGAYLTLWLRWMAIRQAKEVTFLTFPSPFTSFSPCSLPELFVYFTIFFSLSPPAISVSPSTCSTTHSFCVPLAFPPHYLPTSFLSFKPKLSFLPSSLFPSAPASLYSPPSSLSLSHSPLPFPPFLFPLSPSPSFHSPSSYFLQLPSPLPSVSLYLPASRSHPEHLARGRAVIINSEVSTVMWRDGHGAVSDHYAVPKA